jgi:acrylyl-CoA reductase (NADPH)
MTMTHFKAYEVSEAQDGTFQGSFKTKNIEDLPTGDVLINVKATSLNYKDLLSSQGNKGITKKYPHVCGIDAAGIIEYSSDSNFCVGEEVIVTGYDLGMNTWGGFSEYIRVPAQWIVKKPEKISLEYAMCIGTAGFTAGQSILRMQENGVQPQSGPILVTGATGGVGSVAVALLSHLGYEVVAATRDLKQSDFLKSIGAKAVINSQECCDDSTRPLLKSQWAGVVETVGGKLLETAIRSTQRRGVITFCGMILSPNLNTTVFPFILRGLRLIGIDSAECPIEQKIEMWDLLSGPWYTPLIDQLKQVKSFHEIPQQLDLMKDGSTRGRIVFKIP